MEFRAKVQRDIKKLGKIFRQCEKQHGHRKFDDYFDAVFEFKRNARRRKIIGEIHEAAGLRGRKRPGIFRKLLDLTYRQKGSSRLSRGKMLSRWDRTFGFVEANRRRWEGKMKPSKFIKDNGGPVGCAARFEEKS